MKTGFVGLFDFSPKLTSWQITSIYVFTVLEGIFLSHLSTIADILKENTDTMLQDCIFSQYTGGNLPHQGYTDSKDNKYIGRHSLEWFLPQLVPLPSPLILVQHPGSCWFPPTFCCWSCFQIGFVVSCRRQTWKVVAGSDWQIHGQPAWEERQLCALWNIFNFDTEQWTIFSRCLCFNS